VPLWHVVISRAEFHWVPCCYLFHRSIEFDGSCKICNLVSLEDIYNRKKSCCLQLLSCASVWVVLNDLRVVSKTSLPIL
jgi:hypothetical protein